MEVEHVVCVIRECFIYQIPPMQKAEGYMAADWDVTSFLWSGRLRLVSVGPKLLLNLEDPTTGELFAQSPVENSKSVEPVLDSSRYFVIKVVDPATNNSAILGLGFPDRSNSFDLNVAIQDHFQKKKGPFIDKPNEPVKDYSLKEGETFKITLKNNALLTSAEKPASTFDEFGDFQSTNSSGWASFD